MRTHFAITTALALGIPALPAGPAQHAAAASAPKAVVPVKAPGRRISPPPAHGAGIAATADAPAPNGLTLEARQLQGAEAISVAGNAPAGSPITITLLATVSKDVPTIVVSRHSVVADSAGHFAAVIPIASAFERGTLLNILATSVSTSASAQAQLITGEPNAGVSVPLESEQP